MYYKPKFLPTLDGYIEWKNKSPKMVHAQEFAYTFRDIESKFIHDKDDEAEGVARQSQKFVFDSLTRVLRVTFSGTLHEGVTAAMLRMIHKSIEDIPISENSPRYDMRKVFDLFQRKEDEKARYRMVGDVLVMTNSQPRLAIEVALPRTLPAILDRIKKWFLAPSMVAVMLIKLEEIDGYTKPNTDPSKDVPHLINSWAWLNYAAELDSDEERNLSDCTEAVIFDGHVWIGSLICTFELYEREAVSEFHMCSMTKRFEFMLAVPGQIMEETEELKAFEHHFTHIWHEAINAASIDGYKPFEFDWKLLTKYLAEDRLRYAFHRYRAWYIRGLSGPSSV